MLKFKKLSDKAFFPQRSLSGDAGLDVFTPEYFQIEPWADKLISIEIACEFENDYVLMVCNKSGISTKKKLLVGADTIDSNYRGPIHIHLFNHSDKMQKFSRGDKIAQLILFKIWSDDFEIVEELSETHRGDKGFGSTGTNISN